MRIGVRWVNTSYSVVLLGEDAAARGRQMNGARNRTVWDVKRIHTRTIPDTLCCCVARVTCSLVYTSSDTGYWAKCFQLRAEVAHCAAAAGLAVALSADNIGRKRAWWRRGWAEKSGQPEEPPRVQRGALSRRGGRLGPGDPCGPGCCSSCYLTLKRRRCRRADRVFAPMMAHLDRREVP